MKALYLCIAAFLAMSPNVRAEQSSQVIAHIQFNYGLVSYGSPAKIVQVQLDSQGIVWASLYEGVFAPSGEPLAEAQLQLDTASYYELVGLTAALSTAELDHEVNPLICRMLPPGVSPTLFVRRGYDSIKQAFLGDLAEVYTREGCWAVAHISPKDRSTRDMANELIGALKMTGHLALAQ